MSPHNSAWIGELGVRVRLFEGSGEATATLGWNPGSAGAAATEGRGLHRAGPHDSDQPIRDVDASASDPRTDHDRRASGRLRRYAVQNGCDRLVTLTFRDQTSDLPRVARLTARFLRRLRERHPDIAYVRVFERHATGMLHVHLAVNRWVAKEELAVLWGHGFVDVRRKLAGKSGTRPGREAARRAARYIGKYVVKDPVRMPGGHRYEVRQGCQPGSRVVWVDGLEPGPALDAVLDSLGIDRTYVWTSAGSPDWTAPPTAFQSW